MYYKYNEGFKYYNGHLCYTWQSYANVNYKYKEGHTDHLHYTIQSNISTLRWNTITSTTQYKQISVPSSEKLSPPLHKTKQYRYTEVKTITSTSQYKAIQVTTNSNNNKIGMAREPVHSIPVGNPERSINFSLVSQLFFRASRKERTRQEVYCSPWLTMSSR